MCLVRGGKTVLDSWVKEQGLRKVSFAKIRSSSQIEKPPARMRVATNV